MGRNRKYAVDFSVLHNLEELLNSTFAKLDANDRQLYVEALYREASRFTGVATARSANPIITVISETLEAPATKFIAPVDLRWTPRRMPQLSKGQRCRQLILNEYRAGGTPQSALERLEYEIGPKSMTIVTIRKWFVRFHAGDTSLNNRYKKHRANLSPVQDSDDEQTNNSTASSSQNNVCSSPSAN